MVANTTGTGNVAVGNNALDSNTTGDNNVAIGAVALGANTTAGNNTAVGSLSLDANTTGASNVALGRASLTTNTTGSNNIGIGVSALEAITSGASNTAVGNNAFVSAQTSTYNTAIGNGAGSAMTAGAKNTIIGCYSGNEGGLDIRTADNNIVLSDGDGNPRGYYLGSDTTWYFPDVYNDASSSSANVVVLDGGRLLRSTSSRKYKNTINDATHGLTELVTLRPVTYKGNNDGDTVFGGLIAEEVHDAGLTEFVAYNKNNEPDSLHYGNMVSLCIKAIQELKTELDSAKARITTLEGE